MKKLDGPSHSTFIENKASQFSIAPNKLEQITTQICTMLGVSQYEISIQFVDSNEIQKLNNSFRGIDKATDVLSFPQLEWDSPLESDSNKVTKKAHPDGPPETLGDVVICPSIAFENAKNINQSLDREICFLLVHGILHLCGHDHIEPSDEKLMLVQQKKIMTLLNQASEKNLTKSGAKSASDVRSKSENTTQLQTVGKENDSENEKAPFWLGCISAEGTKHV